MTKTPQDQTNEKELLRAPAIRESIESLPHAAETEGRTACTTPGCEMTAAYCVFHRSIHAPVQTGWQSIESAPKDGTYILWWDGEYVTIGKWFLAGPVITGGEDGDSAHPGWMPTHWMPLPAPPEIGSVSDPSTAERAADRAGAQAPKTHPQT